MKKRFSVALFVGHMESKFSEEIFLGAAHAAEEEDINLVVFPVRFLEEERTNDSQSKKYHYQYNCMFSYAENQSFDAVILETAVMGRYVSPDTLREIAGRFKGTPLITISEKLGDYPCISFETNGIDIEIDHLITRHGRKRIGFVSGPSTNLEAVQRVERYKASLERHGIEYDPALVAEGDFTENCGAVIDKLLDDNAGKIDAVCFANDLMASAGYKEINKRSLRIGKDIMVTGFDDIPESVSMNPPLTTVRARYRDLGMNAVFAVSSILRGEKINDIKVKTELVERDSCGCQSSLTAEIEHLRNISAEDTEISDFVIKLNHIIYSYYSNTNVQPNQRIINRLLRFASIFLNDIRNSNGPLNRNLITFNFDMLLNSQILDFISLNNLNLTLSILCDQALAMAPDEEKREEVYRIFMEFYKLIISHENSSSNEKASHIKDKVRMANSIIGNTIDCFNSGVSIPASIMQNLKAMGIRGSYLYLHEEPVISKSRSDWVQPDYEMLFSFQTTDRFQSFVKGRKILSSCLFRNEYMPENRFTFLASPVFCSEENYGLLLYDIDTDDYNFYNSLITSQLSYAVKLRNMMKAEKDVQTNLKESLTKATSRNEQLNQISKSDELTGILNRRGFLEATRNGIVANTGKKAAVVYADMDNLKQINDIFGHEEGDYAIRKAAGILVSCAGENNPVARFGGDEFAVFTVTDEDDFQVTFSNRIREACDAVNETSGKPYMIRISTGVHEFTCENSTSLHEVMTRADRILYENKKYKVRNVLRNP